MTDDGLARILAVLTGQPSDAIRKALRSDSVLFTSGLTRVEHQEFE